MKCSTRTRYGIRLLVDLALNYRDQPVPMKDIAQRQDVSLQYLQHLITPLITGGILLTVRGAGGGVLLSRAPDEISMREVVEMLEGPVAPVDCVVNPDLCQRSGSCATRDLWRDLKKAIERVLDSHTLQNLAEWQKAVDHPVPDVYFV